ncbi:MAG: Ku domain protein [Bacteroidetes bacterium]|jgi:DNA end-binding protein Ku|nr:Ku domain protein [Bacteroidota bacterium]
MRSIWTGAIGFGLVNIPVKLYSATESSTLDLDMLDKKDHSNIRFLRVNEKTGKEVEWANIVKGYKLPNDDYVVLSDKDFEAASAKKTKTIEITDFVKETEIDSVYYETPYYLEPEKSGARAYALLREALVKTGKVGVASFVLRNKEGLAILRATDDVIILNRIRFHEEIRDTADLNLPAKTAVKANELKMAVSLISQLTDKFDISRYKDTYSADLMKLIKAKSKGKPVKTTKLKVVHNKSKDLMSQLKASLTKRRKAS